MFLAINASSRNITIDFFDKEKSYQLYFQYSCRDEFYPLNISISEFLNIFLQIGVCDDWYTLFMNEQERLESGMMVRGANNIKKYFPHFDLNLLKL
jgi:hypothetical protein